jgi:DNA modification methylase
MLAFALRADGWWLRKDIIWAKPNPMPESATDRPTSSHEHVFLLAKSGQYFYDAEAIREDRTSNEDAVTFRGDCYVGGKTNNDEIGKRRVVGNKRIKVPGGWDRGGGAHGTIHREGRTEATYQDAEIRSGRNVRDVWTFGTAPFPEAHFATFPPALAERCVLAGTSERGCCASCGAPWVRTITKGEPDIQHQRASGGDAVGAYHGQSIKGHDAAGVQNASDVKRRILEGMREKIYDWRPGCNCEAKTVPCVVLDPFGGAGTTGLVADRLGRDAILIELNADYIAMAERRIHKDAGLFAEIAAQ